MPGTMRLFVRVEGTSPFCLLLDDNLLPEHYKQIAARYFKETWHSTRQPPELILVRRIVFRNKDQLLDFRRKKLTSGMSGAAALMLGGRVGGAGTSGGATAVRVYDPLLSVDMLRQQLVATNPPTASMNAECETDLAIKAITLPRLVIKMTDPTASDFLENVVLDTYRGFTTAGELLEALIERYDVPPLARTGQPQRGPLDLAEYSDVTLAVRLRVFRFLEKWVRKCYYDFADDALYRKLTHFVREKIDVDGMPACLSDWMRHCDRTALAARRRLLPPGIVNAALTPTAVLAGDPREIANQLTLLTLHVHSEMEPCELLGRQWEGASAVNVPNFVAYRDFINRVSNWSAFAVVAEPDLRARAHNMTQLLRVCEALRRQHNWDALVAVYGGISDPSVARLTTTAAAIADDAKPLLLRFEELLSLRGTSKSLKAAMAGSPRPSFPSIVVHLRDLMSLDQMPAKFDGGLINFLRCIDQHNLVRFLLDSKGARLAIPPNPQLQGVFSYWRIVEERVLQLKSIEVQPS